MSVSNLRQTVAYGLSDALPPVPPMPIISQRNPTTADKAPFGQIWINSKNNTGWIETSVANNVANWLQFSASGGTGVFASVEATSGNITADAGNIVATAGSVSAHTTVTAATGNIVATAGNIIATAGSITAGTTVTGTTGLTATSGNITASTGQLVTGASSSPSVGVGQIGISAEVDTAQSTGTLSIKSGSTNNGSNTGFIVINVAGTAAYIPYFVTVAP